MVGMIETCSRLYIYLKQRVKGHPQASVQDGCMWADEAESFLARPPPLRPQSDDSDTRRYDKPVVTQMYCSCCPGQVFKLLLIAGYDQ